MFGPGGAMKEHLIFAFLTVVAAVAGVGFAAVASSSSSSSSSDPLLALISGGGGPILVTEPTTSESNNAGGGEVAQEPKHPPYVITEKGLYMSGPPVNETGNTVLTLGYLTAIKGDLKDKQGLAISGAITIAIDEVSGRCRDRVFGRVFF